MSTSSSSLADEKALSGGAEKRRQCSISTEKKKHEKRPQKNTLTNVLPLPSADVHMSSSSPNVIFLSLGSAHIGICSPFFSAHRGESPHRVWIGRAPGPFMAREKRKKRPAFPPLSPPADDHPSLRGDTQKKKRKGRHAARPPSMPSHVHHSTHTHRRRLRLSA